MALRWPNSRNHDRVKYTIMRNTAAMVLISNALKNELMFSQFKTPRQRQNPDTPEAYLIGRPDAVSLHVPPARHLQPARVLAVVLRDDDGVRQDLSILLAEVILPVSDLYAPAAAADLGRHDLGRRLGRGQYRHLLLPDGLLAEADARLCLYAEDVRLAGYQALDRAAELGRLEVARLRVRRALGERQTCIVT